MLARFAAGDLRIAGHGDYIAANRASIKTNSSHIAPISLTFSNFTFQEAAHIHIQHFRQFTQERYIGTAQCPFPLGNRLLADPQRLGHIPLGHSLFHTLLTNQRAGLLCIHVLRLLTNL